MVSLSDIVIIAVILFLAIAGCVQQNPASPIGNETATTTEGTPITTPFAGAPNVTATPTQVQTIKCELCHINPQDLPPHLNGGKYCVNCHGNQVHTIHIGPGTVNLQCQTCHGNPPTVPTVKKGTGPGSYSVCEQCHAPPPDSLKPSNGNLIVIHLSRGKYCTNCHGTDIGAIHAAAMQRIANESTTTGIISNTTK
jgi:hypothetical protein